LQTRAGSSSPIRRDRAGIDSRRRYPQEPVQPAGIFSSNAAHASCPDR
jgi:hypothetical protein